MSLLKLDRKTLLWQIAAGACFVFYFIRAWKAGPDDFIAYYQAGTRALSGLSPYRPEATPYRYLPMTAYFFIPFSFFPLSIARALFFTLNFSAVVTLYSEIRRRLGDGPTLLLVLFFIRFHNQDFGNSQINPILLLLFFYWWKTREKNLMFATLAFSIFASFKLLPFALGLPLLWRGRWKEIQWIALWTVVLNFLPIFFYSVGPLVFKDWYDQARVIDDPAMLSNVQALQSALWWRLEGHLTPHHFAILSRGIQVVLLFGVVLLAPKKNREDWMMAATLAVTVLISPLAWKHNYLQFLPLLFLWFREDPGFRANRTRLLYGIAALGMVIAPALVAAIDREYANRLYFLPWTGALVIFLSLCLTKRAELSGLDVSD